MQVIHSTEEVLPRDATMFASCLAVLMLCSPYEATASRLKVGRRLTELSTMQHATVVCTTLTGVLMRDLRDLQFDVAVVDEAAQVLK